MSINPKIIRKAIYLMMNKVSKAKIFEIKATAEQFNSQLAAPQIIACRRKIVKVKIFN